MSMLPSEKRLNAAGWMCVANALFSCILSIPYFVMPGFEHPLYRALLATLHLLFAATAIGAYVNLALLLNGPFRFRGANIFIGFVIGTVLVSLLFSLVLNFPGLSTSIHFFTTIIIGLSVAISMASGVIHIILAVVLRPLWKVVPALNRYSYALLCFGILSLLASVGHWLPELSRLVFPLIFLVRFATFTLLASVFFQAARMARAGWSNALLAQAENASRSA